MVGRSARSALLYMHGKAGRISGGTRQAAFSLSMAAFIVALPALGQNSVVRYGGEPPWGLEKPVHISGKVNPGEVFEQAIGRGLYFILVPTETGWEMVVADGPGGRTGRNSNNLMECIQWGPCHGGFDWEIKVEDLAVGSKIHLDFNLTRSRSIRACQEREEDCRCASWPNDCFGGMPSRRDTNIEVPNPIPAQPEPDIEGAGQGVFVVTGILPVPGASSASLRFEVDLSFTAGLKPWELPARYIVPKGYKGWVRLYLHEPGASSLPMRDGFKIVQIPQSGVLHTSSSLRGDNGGSQYFYADGTPMGRHIWVPGQGDCQGKSQHWIFFVGTDQEYERMPKNGSGGPRQLPCKSGTAGFSRTYNGTCQEFVNGKAVSKRACQIVISNAEDKCGTHQLDSDFSVGKEPTPGNVSSILWGSIIIEGNKFKVPPDDPPCDSVAHRSGEGTIDDKTIKGTMKAHFYETWLPELLNKEFTVLFKATNTQTWR